MEKAISLRTDIDSSWHNIGNEYDRVYFGNEFCENLIPSLDKVKLAQNLSSQKNLDFTFLTPAVSDNGIEKIFPIFEYLSRLNSNCEIVFNDWGVFYLATKKFVFKNIVVGRLLSRQIRDPRVYHSMKGKFSDSIYQYFKKSKLDSLEWIEFFKENNIHRIELDNLLQGIIRHDSSLKASIHYPFIYTAMSRYCMFAQKRYKNKNLRAALSCDKGCLNDSFILTNKEMPRKLFLKGNTTFAENNKLPNNLDKLNIDRLVFHKSLPI